MKLFAVMIDFRNINKTADLSRAIPAFHYRKTAYLRVTRRSNERKNLREAIC